MNQRQERLLMEYMAADGAFFRDGRYFMMRDVAFYEAWKSKKNYDFSHYELQADIIYGLADKIEQEWEEESLIQGRHLCDGSARFDGWRKDIAEKKKIDRLRDLKCDIQLQEAK